MDLNPGPPDYKSSALPLGHARLGGEDACSLETGSTDENSLPTDSSFQVKNVLQDKY